MIDLDAQKLGIYVQRWLLSCADCKSIYHDDGKILCRCGSKEIYSYDWKQQ